VSEKTSPFCSLIDANEEETSLKIVSKVLVKRVITESSKQDLKASFESEKMQLEQECQQLLFEQRKLKNKLHGKQAEVNKRFSEEILLKEENIRLINFKLEQLDIIDIGSELVEKEVEALVEVSEGMHWDSVDKPRAIIVEDGYVVRIE